MNTFVTDLASPLEGIEVGQAVRFANLAMFPLLRERQREVHYVTLDEAMEAGTAKVNEVSESGTVAELRFLNEGDTPVLLLDGEELVGAKQDRILNVTILAPAHAAIVIPVSCVERGRWRYRSRGFHSSKRVHYAQGRAAKSEQVFASLRHSGTRRSDQGAIWSDLAEKSTRLGARSATAAMGDVFERHEGSIDRFVDGLQAKQGQVGAVIAIDGVIAGLDLFEHATIFAKLRPKLLRGYALDAVDACASEDSGPSRNAEADFLAHVAMSQTRHFPAVGLGEDVRLDSPEVTGSAVLVDGAIVHLGAFPKSRMEGRNTGFPTA